MGNDNIYIMRADHAKGVNVRMGIAKIFGEGFTQWLGFFSNDKAQVAKAFAHSFVLDQFYVAVIGEEVAGIAACTDCNTMSMCLDRKELRKHFGLYRGSIAGFVLKKEFEAPFLNQPSDSGSIEFVGTSSNYLGRGVASKILNHIIEHTSFREYLIEEVADTNIPAMNLYRKLGFEEYKSKMVSRKKADKIGINRFVSLKYSPERSE